ncbi:uncharacterized protein V1516DRAFT_684860 [Lipomyces oligophaga]|uniref:uncharacterized protein n=1 Tax=Lipomyces oligophaga TaxID=45792 RepID=UPI0034D00D25
MDPKFTYFQARKPNPLAPPTVGAMVRSRSAKRLIIYLIALAVVGYLVLFVVRGSAEQRLQEKEALQKFSQSRITQAELIKDRIAKNPKNAGIDQQVVLDDEGIPRV